MDEVQEKRTHSEKVPVLVGSLMGDSPTLAWREPMVSKHLDVGSVTFPNWWLPQ